jgi:hypothetical protein
MRGQPPFLLTIDLVEAGAGGRLKPNQETGTPRTARRSKARAA